MVSIETVKKILILSANPKDTNKLRLDQDVLKVLGSCSKAHACLYRI